MEENYLRLLLQLINGNGNIIRLRRAGMEFNKIGELMDIAAKEGYLTKKNKRMVLSQKGLIKLKDLNISFRKKNKGSWIEPEHKSKIAKIKKNFIFLPSQTDLFLD